MIRTITYTSSDDLLFLKRGENTDVTALVRGILEDVRQNGDDALFAYSRKFDKAELTALEVTQAEIDEAFNAVDDAFLSVLREAKENITAFHKHQIENGFTVHDKDGVILGQRVLPLQKVGLYVPGGTAAYPSSVLMNCIPAVLAGCGEIVMVTPPSADGSVNPAILAAAKVAGVGRIFKVGGAQAVAALAFGTESVPKVDKIVGPGNRYVAEAKKQVFGLVDIDMIAGPSEILIVADGTCNPRFIAADLLSQAEHDRLASAILLTDSQALAEGVAAELERQIPLLERCEIAGYSIEHYGAIVLVDSIETAIDVSNAIAPEHLELCLDNPFDHLNQVQNAGSVFLGKYCPEPLGDYFAGPNHTLPTSGTARFSSPLSVYDFVKRMQFTYYTPDALETVKDKVALFARKEGLTAHAKSAVIRFEKE